MKLLHYFILFPLNKLSHKVICKLKGRWYEFFFNLYTLIFNYEGKVRFDGKFYFIDSKDKNPWRFYHEKIGLSCYKKGLISRAESLSQLYLLNNISFNNEDIIIDCGANNGDFYLIFTKKIHYIGVEPSPIEFSNLENNIKNQTLINKALWKDKKEKMDFYIKSYTGKSGGDSSLIEVKNYEQKIKIDTTTLDEIIEPLNKNVKLVKIEGEGAEPEILEGLSKHLRKVEYITVDAGFERGINQESTLVPCINYLTKNGFKLIDYSKKRTSVLFKNINI
tara:strand:- start:3300 stop:4133 length:834 start_codon:yes stop_codon:yes gene_type:complete